MSATVTERLASEAASAENPWENAQRQFDDAAELLGLDPVCCGSRSASLASTFP